MRAKLKETYRMPHITVDAVEYLRGVWTDVPPALEDGIRNHPKFDIEETPEPVMEMIVKPRKAVKHE